MTAFVRVMALAICGLCLVAAIASPMKGFTRYVDRNDCSGKALDNLFAFEHDSHEDCVRDYYPKDTLAAGDPAIFTFILLPTAIVGALIARRPRRLTAAVWSFATLAITFIYIVATFSLDFDLSGDHTEVHWPAHVVQWSVAAIYLAHLAQLLVLGVHALVAWIRKR